MNTGCRAQPCRHRAGDSSCGKIFSIVAYMSKPLTQTPTQVIEYSNFASAVTGEGHSMPAGFPLPNSSFWQYREPDAVVIIPDSFLRVAAVPYTRGHDSIQFLDNAKHMYFSTRTFACPDRGTIVFSVDLAATIVRGAPGDLYDGFVSFNVLDFSTGAALDFFVGNETIATVYGKLPITGRARLSNPVARPAPFLPVRRDSRRDPRRASSITSRSRTTRPPIA